MPLSFGRFKILCINIFLILFKAATLNPYKLQRQLKEVDFLLHSNCDLCHRFLVILISLYLEIKFVVGYITLAANLIAVFPILTDDLPHLLLPALFTQTLDHVILNLIEVILGYCTIKLVTFENKSVFIILLISKLVYITFAVVALNIYSDYYQQLKCLPLKPYESFIQSQEKLITQQSLQQLFISI